MMPVWLETLEINGRKATPEEQSLALLAISKEQQRIVKLLEEEAERNACSCGDICTAYDNGFEDAILTIRDRAEYPIVE